MDPSQMARTLGARGGRARSLRLDSEQKRRIASLGGHARRQSLLFARRIADNFRYVAAVDELRGPKRAVARLGAFAGPLPGIYRPQS